MALSSRSAADCKRRERWLSGLKRRFAKPLYRVNWYRGFESPPLRQNWFQISSGHSHGARGICRGMAIAGKFEDPYATRRSLLNRVKNPEDQESWQVFYDTYSKMVFSVAAKAGLNHVECEEVVQETFIALAKKMPGFEYDPTKSFRSWLSHTTGFKIKDQFRRRKRHNAVAVDNPKTEEGRTRTIERIADPVSLEVEDIFAREWRERVFELAVEKLKKQVTPGHFQIFDLYVVKKWPVRKVAATLGVSSAQVYLAKHRLWKIVQKEVKALDKAAI